MALLSAQEELDLIRRSQAGDAKATEKLLAAFDRFVCKISRHHARHELEKFEDYKSEAVCGFLRAIQKFDVNAGFRLSTFARWWVRSSVSDFALAGRSLVKLGTNLQSRKVAYGLTRACRELGILRDTLTAADCARIAEHLEVRPEDVAAVAARVNGEAALDAPVGYDVANDNTTWVELLADPHAVDAEAAVIQAEDLDRLREVMHRANLKTREREILFARFSDEPETLEGLSVRYGVSRERIRQLERAALRKLQLAAGVPDQRTCRSCGQTKPLDDFRGGDELRLSCRSCREVKRLARLQRRKRAA